MHPLSGIPLAVASSLPTALHAWEDLMRRGLEAARRGQPGLAEGLCLRALLIAQSLLAGAGDERADDRMAAFVVTHLNLADLHRDADRPHDAVDHLCAAHRTLMEMLRDARTDPALQQAAFRHSRETHAALLAHLGEHGSDPAIVAALRAGCMPFPPHGFTLH